MELDRAAAPGPKATLRVFDTLQFVAILLKKPLTDTEAPSQPLDKLKCVGHLKN
jgi:hypothetical protein